MTDLDTAIELTAADIRNAYRLERDATVEIVMPHREHVTYLKRYGSQEEIDAYYPHLKLRCRECQETAEAAVERLRARRILR
jgi:hypothetical protein